METLNVKENIFCWLHSLYIFDGGNYELPFHSKLSSKNFINKVRNILTIKKKRKGNNVRLF